MPVKELAPDDAVWAVELMERRRRDYAKYSPVFWRPAEHVTDLHARLLRRQISSDMNVALRTDHGFIIVERRRAEGFVDDFAVDRVRTSWATDGAALLLAASQRLAAAGGVDEVRVVTAHADEAKASMLCGLSLRVAEQWWVRELRPVGQPATTTGRVKGPGFPGFSALRLRSMTLAVRCC